MAEYAMVDSAGRRRSPATLPGYHAGRPPRNKGGRFPADPPTVEEIVSVMRQIGVDRHGPRLRALIVVLWRAGLRIQEALALAEPDLDPRRGSIVVRRAKGGRRREIGMPWLSERRKLPVGLLFCVIDGPTRGGRGLRPGCGSSFAASQPRRGSGAALLPTSCATPTRSSSRARECR